MTKEINIQEQLTDIFNEFAKSLDKEDTLLLLIRTAEGVYTGYKGSVLQLASLIGVLMLKEPNLIDTIEQTISVARERLKDKEQNS
jgi:hypothetical protein